MTSPLATAPMLDLHALPSPRQLARDRIQEGALANGAQFALWPDPADSVVSCQIWVRVGSSHEVPGKTGLAHMLEHLMFRGTSSVPDGQFDVEMESMGASVNAATWLDYTCYTTTFQPAALARVLELEADRLANLALEESVFQAERSVVANERRQVVDAEPEALLAEHLFRVALDGSPYHHPTIGWGEDIAAYTLDDVVSFYRRHYAPGNLRVVLVGGFDPVDARAILDATIGSIPAREAIAARGDSRFAPARTDRLRVPVTTRRLLVAWPAPGRTAPGFPAWMVLHELLTGGDSSRLPARLEIHDRLVLSISSGLYHHTLPNLFEMHAQLRPGGHERQVLRGIDAELDDLARNGPSDDEIRSAQIRLRTRQALALASTSARAEIMGDSWISFGNSIDGFDLADAILRVQPDTIRDLARELIDSPNRTIVVGIPEEEA